MIISFKQQFKQAPMTVSLVTLTILMFIVEFLVGGGQTDDARMLVSLGAKWGPDIKLNNQYWRLLMPVFLHAGLMHIVTNMLTLWFIGPLVELAFGSRKFLLLYFFGGSIGNILSYLFAPLTISVGASSALFGLFGGMILYGLQFKDDPHIRSQGTVMIMFVGLNLVSGFTTTGIDMWGHIGGLIGGMIFTIIVGFYGRSGKYPLMMRLSMIAVTIIILILTIISRGGVT